MNSNSTSDLRLRNTLHNVKQMTERAQNHRSLSYSNNGLLRGVNVHKLNKKEAGDATPTKGMDSK
jgi:hypothetical protein